MQDRQQCSFISMSCFQSQKPWVSYVDPPEPLPSKTVWPPQNNSVTGGKNMKHLSGKCFLKESVAVGSCSRGWNARDGSRGMEQPSGCIRDRQGFLIKSSLSHGDYHLLFIPQEIVKNMAHIPLLLETRSQPNNHVTNWPFSCTLYFVFLNLYFQTSVT